MSKVTVIGAGVTGLTTAIRLAEAGHDVTVVAKGFLDGTTSSVATAIWHLFWVDLDDPRLNAWSVKALGELFHLARVSESGVTLVRGIECVRDGKGDYQAFVDERTDALWQDLVPYYERLTREQLVQRLPPDWDPNGPNPLLGGYVIEVPIADMSMYLQYLTGRLESQGVQFRVGAFGSIDEIKSAYESDWYVNCTGLGSKQLVGDDSVIGIKGQIIRVSRDGTIADYIADDFSPRGMTYVLPRGGDVILGGSEDPNEVDDEDSWVDPELAAAILERCVALVPQVAKAEVLEHRAALRPFRSRIRLEIDAEHPDLIHNYGHGGSGVSLSWGCADDVVALITSA